MALPVSAFEPLDDSHYVCEPATIALPAPELDESVLMPEMEEALASQLGHAPVMAAPAVEGKTLSTLMAHRVLRDAIALQLARRGFDGLRMQPLTLVAEMAACFIGAIGTQLTHVEPAPLGPGTSSVSPYLALVFRLQRHTNLRTLSEWVKLKELFARHTELNTMQGTAAAQLGKQKQPCLGGKPPAAVQQLYTALRATWHYKMTPAGRAAHVNAGHADGVSRAAIEPNALQTALPPAELAQVVNLNLKTRRTADAWLHGVTASGASAPPTLFPGAFLCATATDSGTAAPAVKRRKPPTKPESKAGSSSLAAARNASSF